jgi:hypothetical protein
MGNIPVAHKLTTLIHPLPTLHRAGPLPTESACGATRINIFIKLKEKTTAYSYALGGATGCQKSANSMGKLG